MTYLRRCWSRSKAYRVALVLTAVYAVLRLLVQVVFLAGMLLPGPEKEVFIPADLQLYLDAARSFQLRQDLYLRGDIIEVYQYSPAYALAFTPFLYLSSSTLIVVHFVIRLMAYVFLYIWWMRIFCRLELERVCEMMTWTLPVWLVFSAFWADLGYLNIYIIVALLATFLIDAVLNERLGWSLLWLTIILQMKPHWAFAAAVPLLLGRYRFFFKLVAGAIAAYVVLVGITMLVAGPAYVGQQYVAYGRFLAELRRNFPWRGPDAPFLGYNHSVTQITTYLMGVSSNSLRLATIVKGILLLPLAGVCLFYLRKPVRRMGREMPFLALDLTFVLYLGAFIWLDMVWELSLGVVIFAYLLATLKQRWERVLIGVVFLPYALVDFWQLTSFVIWGPAVVVPGPYILTDPSIYVPLIMIVILTFYAFFLRRLWGTRQQAVAPLPAGSL